MRSFLRLLLLPACLAGLLGACLNDAPRGPAGVPGGEDTSGALPDTLPVDWAAAATAAAGATIHTATPGDSGFVGVGERGAVVVSKDGLNWTRVEPWLEEGFLGLAGGKGDPYVTFVFRNPSDDSVLWHSDDGVHWHAGRGLPRDSGNVRLTWDILSWNGARFALLGVESVIVSLDPVHVEQALVVHVSEDGKDWTRGASFAVGVASSRGLVSNLETGEFILNFGGQTLYSKDGKSWRSRADAP